MKDVAVLAGPDLLFATPVKTGGRPVLLATLDAGGRLSFPASGDGQFVTVALPGIDATTRRLPRPSNPRGRSSCGRGPESLPPGTAPPCSFRSWR